MDPRQAALDGDSGGDDEDIAIALLLCQRLITMHAWRRRRQLRGRAWRPLPGSYPGKRGNKAREFEKAVHTIRRQYFGVDGRAPTYDEADFQRRFRMPRALFMRIYEDLKDEAWWRQRPNATGKLQAHPLQKLVAALRVLAYGTAADSTDDYAELSKTTTLEAVTRLVEFILEKYQAFYLCAPTIEDLQNIMRRNA